MAEGLEAETGPVSMTASPGQGFKAMGATEHGSSSGRSPPAEPSSSSPQVPVGSWRVTGLQAVVRVSRKSMEASVRPEGEKQGAGQARSCRALETAPVSALGDTGELPAGKTRIL